MILTFMGIAHSYPLFTYLYPGGGGGGGGYSDLGSDGGVPLIVLPNRTS